jgi:hypothetical protein
VNTNELWLFCEKPTTTRVYSTEWVSLYGDTLRVQYSVFVEAAPPPAMRIYREAQGTSGGTSAWYTLAEHPGPEQTEAAMIAHAQQFSNSTKELK